MAVLYLISGTVIFVLIFIILRLRNTTNRLYSIQEIIDTRTGRKRKRILEGAFKKGLHDDLYSFGPAILSNAVFIESRVPLDKHVFIEALLALARIHPLLRMKFEWEQSKETGKTIRYFTEMEQLTSNELIYTEVNQESHEWKRMLEDELLQGFDVSSGPLWRVSRLKEEYDSSLHLYTNTILFTFHHSICDGTSIMSFYDQLLDVMDQMFHGVFTDDALPTFPLVEPLDELLKEHIELSFWESLCLKIKHAAQVFAPKTNVFLDRFPPPVQRDSKMQARTLLIPSSLTKRQTATLLKNCKANKCTVTGALAAGLALTVGEMLKDNRCPREFSIGVPVNVRKCCKPEVNSQQFGCYIGIIFIAYSLPSEVPSIRDYFWELARKMSTDIKKKMFKNEQYGLLKLLKYVGIDLNLDWENSKEDLDLVGRYLNVFELTNSGNYDLNKQKTFKITGTHFAVAQETVGPVVTVSAVSVSGKLCWTVIHANRAVNHELANGFSELLSEKMEGLACGIE